MGREQFYLGTWTVDPNTNTVRGDTAQHQIDPLAMDVLVFLCERAGDVIGPDELLERFWPGSDVNDNVVHKIITQLRRALGDAPAAPRYIETIRKRGYRIIAEVVFPTAARMPLPAEPPFRGLEAFDERHANLFFGREQALQQLTAIVERQSANASRMTLVLGPSGSGKTSLVRAGLLPRLLAGSTSGSTVPPAACAVVFDCADTGEGGVMAALASSLLDAEHDGDVLFANDSAAMLATRLTEDVAAVIAQLQARLGGKIVLLTIDRLEALFHLPQVTPADRDAVFGVLAALAGAACVHVILVGRNDFYPYFVGHAMLAALIRTGGHFDLTPPSAAELAQIIRMPARLAHLYFGIDAATGEQLDDALLRAATASPEVLPLLQYCLQDLYRQRRADGELPYAAFVALGGLEGALSARAEQVIMRLGAGEVAALPQTLARLVVLAESGSAVTARAVPYAHLTSAAQRALVDALVDARLFVSELANGVPTFSVAHEALLRRWPRVAEWIDAHRLALQARARLAAQARRWDERGRPPDLLLPVGSQAAEAQALVERRDLQLEAGELAFIKASLRRIQRQKRQRQGFLGLVVALALIAGVFGVEARQAQGRAEALQGKADQLIGYMLGELADKLRPLGKLDLLDGVSARALSYLTGTQAGETASLVQRAKALTLLAEVKTARGEVGDAQSVLLATNDLLAKQARSAAQDPALLKAAGENAFWLGNHYLAQKDWGNAERYFQQYRDWSDRYAALDPTNADAWNEQSYAHNNLGTLAIKQRKLAQAAEEFEAAIALKTKVLARAPDKVEVTAELADSLSWLASTRAQQGQLEVAADLYTRGFDKIQALHRRDPENRRWVRLMGTASVHQVDLHLARDLPEQAVPFADQAVTLYSRLVQHDPSNAEWREQWLRARLQRLMLPQAGNNAANRFGELDELARQFQALRNANPTNKNLTVFFARVARLRAQLYRAQQQTTAAAASLAEARQTLAGTYAAAPAERLVRSEMIDLLLDEATFARERGARAAAHAKCEEVVQILSPLMVNLADYRLRRPWDHANACVKATAP